VKTRSGSSVNKWNWHVLDIMMGQPNLIDWFADPDLFDAMEREETPESVNVKEDTEPEK